MITAAIAEESMTQDQDALSPDLQLIARQAVMALVSAAVTPYGHSRVGYAQRLMQRHDQLRAALVAQLGDERADVLVQSQVRWFSFLFEQVCPTPSTTPPFHVARRARLREMLQPGDAR